MPPLLELSDVTKVFRAGGGLGLRRRNLIKAVDNVSFSILGTEPTVLGLVGESGSGKSTIARMILGLLEPASGRILYKDREVRDWLKSDKATYRREVQAIFQDPYSIYNPFYKIDRVFKVGIKKFRLASSNEDQRVLIIEAMEALGLRPQDLLGRYPHQLSGGERQRLMLARIFLINPKLLIADEPVSMIDVSLRSIFLSNLLDLKERLKMSCLYISHDLNIAHYIADEMAILCRGNIVETGKPESIVKTPLHPYTKLLVSSIPIPNPKKRWKDRLKSEAVVLEKFQVEQGCIYSDRCSEAEPLCKKERPQLVEVEHGHKVACFHTSDRSTDID